MGTLKIFYKYKIFSKRGKFRLRREVTIIGLAKIRLQSFLMNVFLDFGTLDEQKNENGKIKYNII